MSSINSLFESFLLRLDRLSFLILPFIILITKFFAFVLTLVRYQQKSRVLIQSDRADQRVNPAWYRAHRLLGTSLLSSG